MRSYFRRNVLTIVYCVIWEGGVKGLTLEAMSPNYLDQNMKRELTKQEANKKEPSNGTQNSEEE